MAKAVIGSKWPCVTASLMKHRVVFIRNAEVYHNPSAPRHNEQSLKPWVADPLLACWHCSFLSSSFTIPQVWPHHAVPLVTAAWRKVGWGYPGGKLSSKTGSDSENTLWLTTAHVKLVLSVYRRYVSRPRQLPARGAHIHKSYVLCGHKL